MSANSEYLTGIPTTPNTVSDSWQPAVEQIDTTKKGWFGISMDDWDGSSTKPDTVLAGSEIEAAGGVIRVVTDETVLDDPGGIAAGTLYLVVDFSGSDPEWYWTNDAPSWNPSLNGFYEAASGSVSWKYTGHTCVWDGSTLYSNKGIFFANNQSGGHLALGSAGEFYNVFGGVSPTNPPITTVTNSGGILPAGRITLIDGTATSGAGRTFNIQVYANSTWTTVKTLSVSASSTGLFEYGPFYSNGSNYRIDMPVTTLCNWRYILYP
jgi:hypothetical protein